MMMMMMMIYVHKVDAQGINIQWRAC